MTDYPRRQIEAMRERLNDREPDDPISDADAEVLLAVSDRIDLLGPSEYSDQRHEFLLKRGMHIAEHVGGIADALEDRDAAERIVRWIHQTYENPESNKDYRVGIRMIGDLATDGDGKPPSIEWIPGGYPSNYDPAPDPSKMYRLEEHIKPMLEVCHNSRDRALIALAFDLGPRPSELFDLTTDRFADHKYGLQVTLEQGKEGTRSPILVPSVPYVQQWLQDHPADRERGAPLWTRKNRVEEITPNRIRDIFKEKAEAAAMTPPSTPTPRRLRKSSASYLASRGVSQAHLEDHHGWTRGSEVASRYISVFGDANDREIAKAHGVDVEEDEPAPNAPLHCPRCERETPRDLPVCMWCNQAINPEAIDALEERQEKLVDGALEADGSLRDDIADIQDKLEQLRAVGLDL